MSSIPKDLRKIIYCTVIRHGGQEEWDYLWSMYKKSNVASEKATIMQSLSCTREVWLLQRFLDMSLNNTSGIRKQDASSVFDGVAGNEVGFYIAKSFLENRIVDIHKK